MPLDGPFLLDPDLLDTPRPEELPGSLAAALNAHGSYETFKFVLRLSPVVHARLAALPTDLISTRKLDFEDIQALSTYLHETIHWWQHAGSTFGLVTSLTYPAEAHANYHYLKTLATAVGFKKSIRQLAVSMDSLAPPEGSPAHRANIIINNQFDFDAFRHVTYGPTARTHIARQGMFESVGHVLGVTYGHVVFQLALVADPDFVLIPNPDHWYAALREQREARLDGYYHGSPVDVPPIGAREIMEGQARFAQIQYLYFAADGTLGWDSFETLGWLGKNVYTEAFETFLELAALKHPDRVDDPIVGLFLLICDMALNPGSGFPFPVVPSTFIEDVDPGTRFCFLARVVRHNTQLAGLIRTYSREEYVEVSQRLADAIMIHTPLDIAKTVAAWPDASPDIAALMDEYRIFAFRPTNLPIRFMLSHFIAFMADKARRPEIFCWPGAWMAGDRVSEEVAALFAAHRAPFIDKADNDGIFPRLYAHRDNEAVQETFETFYAAIITYDLTRQWITEPGPFHYRYDWLMDPARHDEMKAHGDRHFHSIYGVSPDDVEILPVERTADDRIQVLPSPDNGLG